MPEELPVQAQAALAVMTMESALGTVGSDSREKASMSVPSAQVRSTHRVPKQVEKLPLVLQLSEIRLSQLQPSARPSAELYKRPLKNPGNQ
jgi:hypothetical protein